MAGYLVVPNALYGVSVTVVNMTKRLGDPASYQLETSMDILLPLSASQPLEAYRDSRSYPPGGSAFHATPLVPPWMGSAPDEYDWRGIALAWVTPPGGMPQLATAPTIDLYISSDFYVGLTFAPNPPWDYWLAYWWNVVTERWEPPVIDAWESVYALKNFKVKPAVGYLGFYLWRSDIAATGPWNGPYFAVASYASTVNYDYNSGGIVVAR